MTNVRKLLRLLLAGELGVVARLFRRWLWSDEVGVGLRRELDDPAPVSLPKPRVPLQVRPIQAAEEAAFTDTRGRRGEDVLDHINAAHLLETELRTCYVAVDDEGRPVYMQYLIFPDQNERLPEIFGGLIPPLAEDEAALEFAFTLEEYRTQGVMPYVVAELIEEARRSGARRVVTFVPERNRSVRLFFQNIGFELDRARRERYRLFRRSIRFEPIA